ncbi:MAG: alpha/beta fold hydrolase [Myxococcales bacterium]|nr:alpha/beta fold hydrolase [Myxococcales bacterium]
MPETAPSSSLDALGLHDLAVREEYEVETDDGWTLVVTRYRPRPQAFAQPLKDLPMMLVHGFSQNRLTWTSGEFARDLSFFGADLHILELRGHGKSSRSLQFRRHNREGKALPADIAWGWDVDSYFLHDVPAALRAVKERTGHERILYIGHSMGGMIGYGAASRYQDDLLGLVTVGSPSDIGRGLPLLQGLAWASLALPLIDAMLWQANVYRGADYRVRKTLRDAGARTRLTRRLADRVLGEAAKPPKRLRFRVFPVDLILKTVGATLTDPASPLARLPRYIPLMWNPEHVHPERVKDLLTIGGGPEPRAVVEQFCRWIRNNELKCYRGDYDFKEHFEDIRVPLAIIFGDEDQVARIQSTRSIYKRAKSNYLLWRPVRGNSHLDVTMGYDIRQIVYDIKNLADYALNHLHKAPTLPTHDVPVVESGVTPPRRMPPGRHRTHGSTRRPSRRRTSAP